MALVVQKYGGTSMGSIERIRNVAKRVAKTYDAGNDMVVVVSAMSGETNKLVALANEICEFPDTREYDVLVASGEQVSIALLAMCLKSMGYKAKSYHGWQIPIITDSAFSKARIESIDDTKVRADLKDGSIVIVAGFQGVDKDGNITTLGRGGSDTSAVAVAAAFKADVCEIFTDVDGVYTTDPNICQDARKIEKVSYDEMLELASLGAKVLQIRSVEFAKKYNVDVHVRSSFNENPGTMVTKEDKDMEAVLVSGIAYDKNEAKIAVMGVPDKPGIAAKILSPLSDANISVDMIVQNVSGGDLTDFTFTVTKADFKKALAITKEVAKEISAKEVAEDENISKISIVGVGMRSHAGVATKMFQTLAKEGINIQMISTSEIKVSVIVDAKYTELAVRVLHEAFGLSGK
ncbi:aspartate kinase [Geobacter sulfurreducens]|jgi:aspartate kinase|uniref:Aspartokinase n=1 Tax=Geobacter sulfurreducens (strain ATCC 51573 / DSM 12127 / PCA) TaxID=243231 RepID=Q74C75_GEOSL|nr:aspartate kinase [Geobacter sulfurreducens]AAR35176.1 aspartate 4-kinase [Geobacter sulfurreducens PCA]ADI84634.1 aspartate 4-kinase [Geobacter sulfurreducens KN400]AJY71145.1 aspartate kinase [Geobacter sulfurreducens]QVW33753.1 aspartate kinase [Geobacter sulfurreducens]UAC02545.1 aspartate kinase [Geobacter sulfurreducens]